MQLHTYLNYGGNCEEAFKFYEERCFCIRSREPRETSRRNIATIRPTCDPRR